MIGKTTRLLMIGAVAAMVCSVASGATVIDVVSGHLAAMDPDPDPPMDQINPIVFEDDDWTVYVDNGDGVPSVGDIIKGVFDLPKIWEGAPVNSLDVRNMSETDTGTDLSTVPTELTGLFEL